MTDFKFNVGDKVRLESWKTNEWVEILMVGKKRIFAKYPDGLEGSWLKSYDWQLYEAAPQESLIGRTFECEIQGPWGDYPMIKFIKEVK